MSHIPAIGENTAPKLRLTFEERPLPADRKKIVTAFEEILSLGKVQKVVVEVGQPFKFSRLVPPDDLPLQGEPPPVEAQDEDIYALVMNAPMEDFLLESNLPFATHLMLAFAWLTDRKYKPKAFIVNAEDPLRNAFGINKIVPLEHFFGLPLHKRMEIPQDVIVLAAASEDGEVITLSLRMLLTSLEKKS